jgi:hypothetical protein
MVYSNDPEHPQIKLAVNAQIKVPISVEPRGVLLEGFKDDDITAVATIRAHDDQPLILEPVTLSVSQKVTYELKTVEEGKVYQVVFRNISREEDKYSGFLKLKTNYSLKPEITVMVFGYIRGNLQCQPERINFGRIESAQIKNQGRQQVLYQRSIMVSLNRGHELKIERIDINQDLFETQIAEIEAGKRYRIDVILHAERLPKGASNEEMRVHTNLKDNPIKVIPIRVQKI